MESYPLDIGAHERELYLTTVGRKSGQPREIEIWFVTYQGRFYLLAERGHRANWVRNIRANPDVSIRIKQHQFRAHGRILDAEHDRQEWDTVADLARRKYGWGEGLPVAIEVHGADVAASKLGS